MAARAKLDQEERTVEVQRARLIDTLEDNLAKHVRDYEEAMAGYKNVLLSKIEEGFENARKQLESRYQAIRTKTESLNDSDIQNQRDTITLSEALYVDMKVPRSYAKEYEAAIAIARWDVRETLELTNAEFTCFVRDLWDWKSGFDAISTMYKTK